MAAIIGTRSRRLIFPECPAGGEDLPGPDDVHDEVKLSLTRAQLLQELGKTVEAHRLVEIPCRIERCKKLKVAPVKIAGCDDHRYRFIHFSDSPKGIYTVHARHLQIHQNTADLVAVLLENLHSFKPIAGHHNRQPDFFDHFRGYGEANLLIVDDKYNRLLDHETLPLTVVGTEDWRGFAPLDAALAKLTLKMTLSNKTISNDTYHQPR